MNEKRYQLTLSKGPESGKVIGLTSVSMTIGRDPMSEITINDPEVSRRHAQLIGTSSGYRIQDLGSTNGTFIDGVRLGGEPFDLDPGQVISIGGGVVLIYAIVDEEYEHAVTMLDVDIASLDPTPVEEPSEFIHDTPAEDEFDDLPSEEIQGEVIEEIDSEIEQSDEVEIIENSIERSAVDDFSQEPDIESQMPETDWEVPDSDEELPLEAASYDAGEFIEPVVVPHDGEPPSQPEIDEGGKMKRLSTIIAAVVLLLICCCCSSLLFLYYYGGDWLLRQMGLLP